MKEQAAFGCDDFRPRVGKGSGVLTRNLGAETLLGKSEVGSNAIHAIILIN